MSIKDRVRLFRSFEINQFGHAQTREFEGFHSNASISKRTLKEESEVLYN